MTRTTGRSWIGEVGSGRTPDCRSLARARCRRWAGRCQDSLVSAMVLCPCERLVGCVEQRVNGVGTGREGGDADRDCQGGRAAIGRAFLGDGTANVLGDVEGTTTRSPGQDGDNPVVVKPGDDVAGADQGAGGFAHVPASSGPPQRDRAIPGCHSADRSPRTRGREVRGAAALDSARRVARHSRRSRRESESQDGGDR